MKPCRELREQWGEHQRGQEVGDGDLPDPQQPQGDADQQQPPVAVSAARCGGGRTSPSSRPSTVSPPCTVTTVSALAATPQPKDAANAMAAKPSRTAFR